MIFRREKSKIYYLLLYYSSGNRRPHHYWDFPKGHVEKGESAIETARREIGEETGLKNLRFIQGFREWIKYFFRYKNQTIFKIVTFYLVEAKEKKVKISPEHIGYEWLSYQDALKRLTFQSAKDILKKADHFLRCK